MANIAATAISSFSHYLGRAWRHDLELRHNRIGKLYSVERGVYKIFRETERPIATGETVILVIGFRLKLIRSNRFLHWLFQRVCILTTPFWSGLAGFKTKLWMFDPETKNYLGMYDWRGKQDAQKYLDFLLPILNFFSVHGTVWTKQLYKQNFENYMTEHTS